MSRPNWPRWNGGGALGSEAMTAQVLDGELVAAAVKGDLRHRIDALRGKGVIPGLGTLLVGDDGPSANYVSMKHRDSEELGINSRDVRLPADATQQQVLDVVRSFNADPDVHAYL